MTKVIAVLDNGRNVFDLMELIGHRNRHKVRKYLTERIGFGIIVCLLL